MNKIIGVIDYGFGNHSSVINAISGLNYKVVFSNDVKTLETTDLIVLPGVGAFPKAMETLTRYGMDLFIKSWAQKSKPIVGICLGMQLLTEQSEEFSITNGLGLIPGKIIHFPNGRRHIGWNSTEFSSHATTKIKELNGHFFYFNHTFYYTGDNSFHLGTSTFDNNFASVIKNKNVTGIQFHPEKSQESGRLLLKAIFEDYLYA